MALRDRLGLPARIAAEIAGQQRRRSAKKNKRKIAGLTHRAHRGAYLHPGHFSMEIPGQLSAEINISGQGLDVDGSCMAETHEPDAISAWTPVGS